MTHNNHENLSMMDAVTTKYGKTTFVTVSKTLAIILVLIFFICLVATGLLVYSFTSNCPKNETHSIVCETKAGSLEGVIIDVTTLPSITTTVPVISKSIDVIDSTSQSKRDLDIRLTRSVVPHSYDLYLIPFIEEGNFTFHGNVTILINVTKAICNITLHSDSLKIKTVSVMNINYESVSVKDVRIVKKKQFLIIDLDGVLDVGKQYYVYIAFNGVLNDILQGFYRSSYVENNVTSIKPLIDPRQTLTADDRTHKEHTHWKLSTRTSL